MKLEKSALLLAVRDSLRDRLADLESSRDAAISGTRIDQDRPANRGERAAVSSQGYLALGLGQRIEALRDALELLERIPPDPRDRVCVGALVTLLDEHDAEQHLLVLPGGEGLRLHTDQGEVTVVSPGAPVIRPLLGLSEGASAPIQRPGGPVEVEVVEVR